MHGALVGDLHQLLALLVVKRALQRDESLDAVDLAHLGVAGLAILRVNLAVRESHRDIVERDFLEVGIEPDGH